MKASGRAGASTCANGRALACMHASLRTHTRAQTHTPSTAQHANRTTPTTHLAGPDEGAAILRVVLGQGAEQQAVHVPGRSVKRVGGGSVGGSVLADMARSWAYQPGKAWLVKLECVSCAKDRHSTQMTAQAVRCSLHCYFTAPFAGIATIDAEQDELFAIRVATGPMHCCYQTTSRMTSRRSTQHTCSAAPEPING